MGDIKEIYNPLEVIAQLSKLKNVIEIEQFDEKTGETVDKVRVHNTMTGLPAGILGPGDFNKIVSAASVMPIVNKLLGGIILTDADNDASEMCIADDANITATAGDDAFTSSTPSARGSYSAEGSGYFEDQDGHGYQHVWIWTANQGFLNGGRIKSGCLTLAELGKVDFSETAIPNNAAGFDVSLGGAVATSALSNLHIIDYDNNRGYKLSYDNTASSEKIIVDIYEMNTATWHLMGESMTPGRSIGQIEVPGALTLSRNIIAYDAENNTAHWLNYTPGTGNIVDVAIDLTNETSTTTSHTFTGVQFKAVGLDYGLNYMLIKDGYLWALSHNGTKIMKCNLSQDADVDDIDNPLYTVAGITAPTGGPAVVLPNGDFILTQSSQGTSKALALWHHNNRFYLVWESGHSGTYSTARSRQINGFGSMLTKDIYSDTRFYVGACFPMVCSVFNLSELKTRTAGLGMKVTYKLYEQEPS